MKYKTKSKKYAANKKKYGPKLARTYVSRKRAVMNNRIYNALKKYQENKIIPLERFDEYTPLPIQIGAQTYWAGFVLGENPIWPGAWNPLKGIATVQGDLSTQRNGNYVYLNKSTMMVEIDTNALAQQISAPMEFRMILFKARRSTDPQGLIKTPDDGLFLDNIGAPIGHASAGVTGSDILSLPTNKRDWVIFMDKKFCLSSPSSQDATSYGYTGKYPVFKRQLVYMNHKIKCRYPPTNPVLSEPVNYNYVYGFVIYARSIGKDMRADNWEVNIRGSTSFSDL